MRTFAELLTEYMARTGISDSELARTLGVRRQTVFRWKEGLVEKPRYREDILRVADRLRLSPQERDELLLAAGFPPESVVGPGPEPTAEPVEMAVPPPSVPSRAYPKAGMAGAAALVFLIAIGLLVLWLQPGAGAAYPVAAPGESLIVVGALGSPQPPAETPSRRLPTENAAPSNQDVSDRIRAALEREIQAARLEHIRVVVWPERIPNAPDAAETVRRRANARLVIAGTFEGSDLVVSFAIAPAASRADDLPLDALVSAPLDMPLKLSTTPDQVQMLAFLALSQVYVDQGDFEMARAAMTLALSHSPTPVPATLYAYQGYLSQIDKPPDLVQAIQFYTQTLDLAPNSATPLVNRGVAYIRQDQPSQWQSDLTRVLALNPDHVVAQEALCWGYALDQQPDRALPHCDTAVRLDPSARSRDARAIVYAELGRLSDAAADWQAFLNWLGQQPESLRVRYGSSRSDWLQKAQAGQNPIDPPIVDKLRRE